MLQDRRLIFDLQTLTIFRDLRQADETLEGSCHYWYFVVHQPAPNRVTESTPAVKDLGRPRSPLIPFPLFKEFPSFFLCLQYNKSPGTEPGLRDRDNQPCQSLEVLKFHTIMQRTPPNPVLPSSSRL